MVRVLQVGMTRNIGGLETYLIQQFLRLDRSKLMYDFVNITGEYELAFSDIISKNGSKIYSVCSRHRNPLKHYFQWMKLMYCCRGRYQTLVVNANSLEYVFPLFCAMLAGIPNRIIHSHNAGYDHEIGLGRKLLIQFNRWLMRFCATDYFSCSQKAGEWMFGKGKNFQVIHNAIELGKFTYNLKWRNKKRKELYLNHSFVVGHVGRFGYQKNHSFMIQVFKEICDIYPDSILLLIGDAVGDQTFLLNAKEQVKKYGLEKQVMFLGLRNDVNELMQAMDCFVLPSHFEGMPLVGVEAQAAGLPCLFADTITQEVAITPLAEFLSLESGAQEWAEKIVGFKDYARRDMTREITEAGYNIKNVVDDLYGLFGAS